MTRRIIIVLAALNLAAAAFAGEDHHVKKGPSSPSFDAMKSLVGEWKANVPPMGDVTATYSLHSDASALVEELKMPGEMSMVTVYYPTANGVAMTHYCSSHNQPHMVAKGTDTRKVSFSTVRVDNLSSKDAEHMKAVSFDLQDADHFTATWTHAVSGKENATPFVFTRIR